MKKISILYLEDDELDVELIRNHLENADFDYSLFHVQNKQNFKIALKTMKFDVILADFNLPDIDGYGVLYTVKEIDPDIPTIILSGTINEDVAIDTLKYGAVDYIFKSKLDKIVESILSAVKEASERKRRKDHENEIMISEAKYRTIFNEIPDVIIIIDIYSKNILEANEHIYNILGYRNFDIIGKKINTILPRDVTSFPDEPIIEQLYIPESKGIYYGFIKKNGEEIKLYTKIKPIPWQDRKAWLMEVLNINGHGK